MTTGSSGTGQYVHLMVKQGTTVIGSDYAFTSGNTLSNLALETTPTAHDFSLLLWLDENDSGVFQTGDPTREVDVHVVTVESLTMWDSDDSTDSVSTTDATEPALATGEESDGMVHIGFTAGFPGGTSNQAGKCVKWKVTDGEGNLLDAGDFGDSPSQTAVFRVPEDGNYELTALTGPPTAMFNPDPAKAAMLKVTGTDTSIPFWFPFKGSNSSADPQVVSKAEITTAGKIMTTVEQGKGYKGPNGLGAVMRGANEDDTDSAQFAIRYKDANGNVVGVSYKNSKPQGKRTYAADWSVETKDEKEFVSQEAETSIPAEATDIDIVLVYTDILEDPPYAYTAKGPNEGDMPAIIGYWHLHRSSPTSPWVWTKLDMPSTTAAYPNASDFRDDVSNAQDFVYQKTGYILRARPAEVAEGNAHIHALLEEPPGATPDPTSKGYADDIHEAIQKAVKAGEIERQVRHRIRYRTTRRPLTFGTMLQTPGPWRA